MAHGPRERGRVRAARRGHRHAAGAPGRRSGAARRLALARTRLGRRPRRRRAVRPVPSVGTKAPLRSSARRARRARSHVPLRLLPRRNRPRRRGAAPHYDDQAMIVSPDGSRLAKRAGGAALRDQRAAGVSPGAVVASLAASLGLVEEGAPPSMTPRELLASFDPACLAGKKEARALATQ